jgi:hypothetical protein
VSKFLLTVNGQTFVREATVAKVAGGTAPALLLLPRTFKAVDPREADEERLRQALIAMFDKKAPEVAGKLRRGEMPTDAELSGAFARVLEPQLVETAAGQAMRLGAQVGVQFDPAIVNVAMAGWARTYTYDLVRGLTDTTQKGVQNAMTTFIETPGMTRGELEKLLRDLPGAPFSDTRAESIAITETTRAYSRATSQYQRELADMGITMERFNLTANDELVCPYCGPLHMKPESEWPNQDGPPWHPRCRCSSELRSVEAARPAVPAEAPITPEETGPARDVQAVLDDKERQIAPDANETAIIIDQQGEEIFRKGGGKDYVSFTESEISRMADAILTHNHPSGGAFSPQDISMAYSANLQSIRAVGTKYRYILTRPATGWAQSVD